MRKSIPRLLWLSIVWLGIIGIYCLLTGLRGLWVHPRLITHAQDPSFLQNPETLFILTGLFGVLCAILLVGLVLGSKWAYLLTLVCAVLAVALAFYQGALQGMMTVIMFVPVVVPMVICTRFFFPGETPDAVTEESGT